MKLNHKFEFTNVNQVLKRCLDKIIAFRQLVEENNVKANENVTQDAKL